MEHPYGFIGFMLHPEFILANLFCQDNDVDVLDFDLNDVDFLAFFSLSGLSDTLHFCRNLDFVIVYFIMVDFDEDEN